MPVILPPEAWPVWLGEGVGVAASWLRPAADDVLRLWPVSRAVNNVRNDGAHLLDPLAARRTVNQPKPLRPKWQTPRRRRIMGPARSNPWQPNR